MTEHLSEPSFASIAPVAGVRPQWKIGRLQAALMEASETFLKIGSMEGAPHRRGPLYSAANRAREAAKDNGYGPVRA